MPVLRVMLAFLLAAGLLAVADLLRSTNNLRAMVHRSRLQTSTTLSRLAHEHAKAMASRRWGLWHTNIAPRVRGWAWLGQNVGYGPTVASLQHASCTRPGTGPTCSTGVPTASASAPGATVTVPCGWRSTSCRPGSSSGTREDL